MKTLSKAALFLALMLPLPATAETPDAGLHSGNAVFDKTVEIVLANFFDVSRLDGFRDAVRLTVGSLPDLATAEPAVVDDAVDFVLASLETSHTGRFTPDSVDYYELLDVFRYGVRDALQRLYPPEGDITYDGIGIATKTMGGKAFVTNVYDGGPAAKAGLTAGDEIVFVDGQAFKGAASFHGQAGKTAILTVRREADAAPMTVYVPVEKIGPSEFFLKATADSARVIDRDGYRIGYLRVWEYTERDMEGVIDAAITGPLAEADALILDLRCRWGGAPADAADTFIGGSPDMTMVMRGDKRNLLHARWRKPLVAIIDEGTRSGMEIFAYALKTNGVRLIGTRTAGNVVAGRGYLLPDDSLLELAVADVFVDGERLEGVGVTPDVAMPFDVRYAAGADPQLDAALTEMAKSLANPGTEGTGLQ